MPHTKPFAWLLAVGMLCSVAGLASTRLPASARADQEQPAPSISAETATSAPAEETATAVVTQATPDAPADSATSLAASETVRAEEQGAVATPAPSIPAALEPAPASTVQALPANVSQSAELQRDAGKARALLTAMNDARVSEGLAPLEWDASLEDVAYARAANLVENGYFDHYAPDGESAFSELAARGIRYRLAGENLARNNYVEGKTVQAAFDGLMNSPGHRANILEPRFSSVGVACVRDGKMWIYVTVFLN